jgi:hypothetical protein
MEHGSQITGEPVSHLFYSPLSSAAFESSGLPEIFYKAVRACRLLRRERRLEFPLFTLKFISVVDI